MSGVDALSVAAEFRNCQAAEPPRLPNRPRVSVRSTFSLRSFQIVWRVGRRGKETATNHCDLKIEANIIFLLIWYKTLLSVWNVAYFVFRLLSALPLPVRGSDSDAFDATMFTAQKQAPRMRKSIFLNWAYSRKKKRQNRKQRLWVAANVIVALFLQTLIWFRSWMETMRECVFTVYLEKSQFNFITEDKNQVSSSRSAKPSHFAQCCRKGRSDAMALVAVAKFPLLLFSRFNNWLETLLGFLLFGVHKLTRLWRWHCYVHSIVVALGANVSMNSCLWAIAQPHGLNKLSDPSKDQFVVLQPALVLQMTRWWWLTRI